jgi:cytochrome c peroxidase
MREYSYWRRILAGCVLLLVVHAGWSQADELDKIKALYKRPSSIPFPAQNPYTPEKAALGKMLFFDPRLSRDQNLNCASCHNPSFGWEVPFAKAIGAAGAPLRRQSPTVLNRAWAAHMFWDGRASSLEEQAKGPIESKAEMDIRLGDVVKRLGTVEDYRKVFNTAFPGEGISENNILKALGTYERTLVSGTTPFDRWVEGNDAAISASAKRGFALFNGKARCSLCHSGWNFSDEKFHDIGTADELDKGRFEITGKQEDLFAMKTPTLREVAHRSPYGHDGSLTTLDVVVQHYIQGGTPRPSRSPLIQPVPLTGGDVKDLVEFMKTLSSDSAAIAMPNLPVPQ